MATLYTRLHSILICITCVTTLTLNYTNRITLSLLHNQLLFIYCLSKLLFLFFIVRETHNTIKETNKTVSIAHEALSLTTNNLVIKELEILIMTCWNHPIVFDVYDFFDLDYSLLQSVVAAVVTYVVVLVQLQLAIMNNI
ncbi:7TM chemoreceptor [Cinara cedri]|uniref:7TM chemoreceptor n=1 Tax=Cinara cedri TaxID=506608 RepID=A0A5E4MNG6_9HEMI|nr:7TM chemoreceptor [Cinara cedri]